MDRSCWSLATCHSSLLLVLIDVAVGIAHALNLLGVFVWNFDTKLFFKTHDEFYGVQRISTQIIDETRIWSDLVLVYSQFVHDYLLNLILDLWIGHFVLLLYD